jgi:hypothetical protein
VVNSAALFFRRFLIYPDVELELYEPSGATLLARVPIDFILDVDLGAVFKQNPARILTALLDVHLQGFLPSRQRSYFAPRGTSR